MNPYLVTNFKFKCLFFIIIFVILILFFCFKERTNEAFNAESSCEWTNLIKSYTDTLSISHVNENITDDITDKSTYSERFSFLTGEYIFKKVLQLLNSTESGSNTTIDDFTPCSKIELYVDNFDVMVALHNSYNSNNNTETYTTKCQKLKFLLSNNFLSSIKDFFTTKCYERIHVRNPNYDPPDGNTGMLLIDRTIDSRFHRLIIFKNKWITSDTFTTIEMNKENTRLKLTTTIDQQLIDRSNNIYFNDTSTPRYWLRHDHLFYPIHALDIGQISQKCVYFFVERFFTYNEKLYMFNYLVNKQEYIGNPNKMVPFITIYKDGDLNSAKTGFTGLVKGDTNHYITFTLPGLKDLRNINDKYRYFRFKGGATKVEFYKKAITQVGNRNTSRTRNSRGPGTYETNVNTLYYHEYANDDWIDIGSSDISAVFVTADGQRGYTHGSGYVEMKKSLNDNDTESYVNIRESTNLAMNDEVAGFQIENNEITDNDSQEITTPITNVKTYRNDNYGGSSFKLYYINGNECVSLPRGERHARGITFTNDSSRVLIKKHFNNDTNTSNTTMKNNVSSIEINIT